MQVAVTTERRTVCGLSADGFFLRARDSQVIHRQREGEGGLTVWGQRTRR